MSDEVIINLKDLNDYQRGFIEGSLNTMQGNRESPEMQDDRVNIAWNQGIAKGKAEERQAIVNWLLSHSETGVADAINKLEYLNGGPLTRYWERESELADEASRKKERDSIVKWLNDPVRNELIYPADLAYAIERNEHLEEDSE